MYLFPIFWVSADWGFEVAFKFKNLSFSATLKVKNNLKILLKTNKNQKLIKF